MKLKTVINEIRHEVNVLAGEETKHKIYSSQQTFSDEPTAREAFERSTEKLFNVNGWSGLSTFTANFILHDQLGNRVTSRQPQVGDYLKIELPGPMPENWVQVVHVATEDRSAEFTVRPSKDPQQTEVSTAEVAHFFQSQARSTFRVELAGCTITAYEIGQNEAINNQDSEAGNRAVVNTLIAEAGFLFYQDIQWKALTNYLVHLSP